MNQTRHSHRHDGARIAARGIRTVGATRRQVRQQPTSADSARWNYLSGIGAILVALVATPAAGDEVDFTSDVRPILSNVCFHCHGPDEDTRSAGLRLDRPSGLFGDRGGYAAVVRGDADSSELVQRILSDDPDLRMPPSESNKSLTEEQKDILVRWVEAGAPWEQHWAFVPPHKIEPPAVSGDRAGWPRNEIDAFVLARLQAAGLQPAEPAPTLALIRRVFLDLIGLPPTPDEADHWLSRLQPGHHGSGGRDDRAVRGVAQEEAWQDLIDDLLSRPEYGERWARRWLDLARYADTNGYEKDRPRSIWPWRDWVVDALNSDQPFDEFTIEQIAGDLLPDATRAQRVATGFHRNTMLNEEGGIDPLEFRFHAMTDRVATTGTTWLGLTIGCAQCHTHKYDPIAHHEYYQLMAFLNNCDEPALELRDAAFHESWERNQQKADALLAALPEQWPVTETVDRPLTVTAVSGAAGEEFARGEDGTIRVAGAAPERATYVIDLVCDVSRINTLTLHATTPEGQSGPGRTEHGNFVLTEIGCELLHEADGEVMSTPVPLTADSATIEQPGFPLPRTLDGKPETGWAVAGPGGVPKSASATWRLELPGGIAFGDGERRLRITLRQDYGRQHTLGQFRLSAGERLSAEEIAWRRQMSRERQFQSWLTEQRATAVDWQTLQPTATDANLALLEIEDDHSVFASGDTAKRDDYEVTFAPHPEPITALRLETLPDERLPARGPGTTYYEGTPGDFFLTEIRVQGADRTWALQSATESYARNRFGSNPASAAKAIDGDVQSGWSVHDGQGQRHTAVFELQEPIPAGVPVTIRMTFGRHFASSLGRFRFAACNSSRTPVARRMPDDTERLLLVPPGELSDAQREQLLQAFLMTAPETSETAARIRRLQLPPDVTTTLVMQERPPENPRATHRHHRGEYLQPREEVQPGVPDVLHAFPEDAPRNRLGFARWLVDRSNPLTARVVVNRHWAALMGTGIVETVSDFGLQGSPPSHPDLLDWLAVTFMDDDGWSIKQLHRRIVSSATYRQSAVASPAARERDVQNRLLSHANRLRLEAEIIRDAALRASGLLSLRKGGPPVHPLQPPGITEVAFGSPSWSVSEGENRYRRSLYTEIKRTAPFAMILTFDGPSGESCVAQRNRSNSPLQALTLLNDVMFMDIVREAGWQIVADVADGRLPGDDAAVVTRLFRRLLTRPPDARELDRLQQFVERVREQYAADESALQEFFGAADAVPERFRGDRQAAVDAAAWGTLLRALLSLDEAVTRP